MPEIAAELNALFDMMTGKLSTQLVEAWNRGMCDGLELAAQMGEELLAQLDCTQYEIVLSFTQLLRQVQLGRQLDAEVAE